MHCTLNVQMYLEDERPILAVIAALSVAMSVGRLVCQLVGPQQVLRIEYTQFEASF